MDKWLVDFQRRNCTDCKFADKPKVGTGEPCCTTRLYLGDHKDGVCYAWKPDVQTNARLNKARKLVNRAISRM